MKPYITAILVMVCTNPAFAQQHDEHQHHNSSGASQHKVVMDDMQSMGDMGTDPWLSYAKVDQLEWRNASDTDITAWDISAWSGKSIDKIWFNAEGEHAGGDTEHAQAQLLYSHAVATFWDLQAGVRSDFEPGPGQQWAAIGVRGLAPYWFDIDATFFIADHGRTGTRLKAEYELMLTQKLVLVPDIEANAYSKDDERRGIGSGLSDIEVALRLKYEIVREIAPYIGVMHTRKLGATADYARAADEDVRETLFVAGISLWF
jgi:copper resistance protein B